jgi:hypothetical protein
MSQTRNFGQDVQAEILKTVRRGQEVVIEAIRTWTDQVRTIAPPMPEVSLPFASKLPRPEELVGNAYDLAERLLAGQRKFAEDVLHATAPLMPGHGDATARKTNGSSAGPAEKADGTTAKNGAAAKKTGGTAARKTDGTTARKTDGTAK